MPCLCIVLTQYLTVLQIHLYYNVELFQYFLVLYNVHYRTNTLHDKTLQEVYGIWHWHGEKVIIDNETIHLTMIMWNKMATMYYSFSFRRVLCYIWSWFRFISALIKYFWEHLSVFLIKREIEFSQHTFFPEVDIFFIPLNIGHYLYLMLPLHQALSYFGNIKTHDLVM